MSRNLLEGYTEVLKMWPSRPEDRVKFQEDDKPPVSRNKRRAIGIAGCSQFSERLRRGPDTLESVSCDNTVEATKALLTRIFEEPIGKF